jgi:hypothetical protein
MQSPTHAGESEGEKEEGLSHRLPRCHHYDKRIFSTTDFTDYTDSREAHFARRQSAGRMLKIDLVTEGAGASVVAAGFVELVAGA